MFLIEFFPYIFVFAKGIIKRLCVAGSCACLFGIKSRKRGTEFGAMLDLVHKKTVLKI